MKKEKLVGILEAIVIIAFGIIIAVFGGGTALDIYFAIVNELDKDDQVHTVPTVDNNMYGITMKLADYGPGVPSSEIELITNKFYRGKQWADSKEEGNGLGLYIAKILMEKMKGSLVLETVQPGLCVTLLIPLS